MSCFYFYIFLERGFFPEVHRPMSYSYFNYPNPTSISPYKPGYQDWLSNQQFGTGGATTSYALNAFSGAGTTRFNVRSTLPVYGAVIDKFETPLQFPKNLFDPTLAFLMNRSLQMAQGMPYNLYFGNGGRLIQAGSQVANLLAPQFLQNYW